MLRPSSHHMFLDNSVPQLLGVSHHHSWSFYRRCFPARMCVSSMPLCQAQRTGSWDTSTPVSLTSNLLPAPLWYNLSEACVSHCNFFMQFSGHCSGGHQYHSKYIIGHPSFLYTTALIPLPSLPPPNNVTVSESLSHQLSLWKHQFRSFQGFTVWEMRRLHPDVSIEGSSVSRGCRALTSRPACLVGGGGSQAGFFKMFQ